MAELDRVGTIEYPGLEKYIDALVKWFYPQQRVEHLRARKELPNGPNGQWKLFLGVCVYGRYVDRFLKLCVPSLLAQGNVDSLLDPLIVVHTDEANVERLRIGLKELAEAAHVEIYTIPQNVIAQVPDHPPNKYWLLAGVHNLQIQMAKYRGFSYHMLMPDHIYATGYFEGIDRLRREGKSAIVQGAISATMEDVEELLLAAKGVHKPEELAALSLTHVHSQIRPFVMNGRKGFPSHIFMLMAGRKSVQIMSPHMSVVYLSHDVLMKAPLRLFNTIDGQLPFFIPDDVEPYVPTPADGMVYCEVSDRSKDYFKAEDISLIEFCAKFWVMVFCDKRFERFLHLTTELPLPEGYRCPMPPMEDEEIANLKASVWKTAHEMREAVLRLVPKELRTDPITKGAFE